MKKLILRIAIGGALILIVGLVVLFMNLNTIVKTGVETVGPQLTKVDVRLGAAKLSPFGGNGELSELFVGNPEGYDTPSAIQVGSIAVAVKLSSALSDTIVIESVNIQSPEITFEGGLTGNNLSQILENLEGAPEDVPPTPEGKPASAGGKKFVVKDVVVNGGKIHVKLRGISKKSFTIPLPAIHLTNIGSENQGVTAAQLCKELLKPIFKNALDAVIEAIKKGATNLKNLDAEDAGKAVEGIKGLFKK